MIKAKNAISTDTKAGRKLRNKALEAGYESKNLKTFSSSWLLADDLQIKNLGLMLQLIELKVMLKN